MSIKYGIFDSTEVTLTPEGFARGNKAVDAAFLASIFKNLFTNGIFQGEDGTALRTLPIYYGPEEDFALQVKTAPGGCHINGYFAFEDEETTVTFTPADTDTLYVHRLRLDMEKGEITRAWIPCHAVGEFFVANDGGDGMPLRTDTVCDLITASVLVPANCTATGDMVITDLRRDEAYCGVVAVK